MIIFLKFDHVLSVWKFFQQFYRNFLAKYSHQILFYVAEIFKLFYRNIFLFTISWTKTLKNAILKAPKEIQYRRLIQTFPLSAKTPKQLIRCVCKVRPFCPSLFAGSAWKEKHKRPFNEPPGLRRKCVFSPKVWAWPIFPNRGHWSRIKGT